MKRASLVVSSYGEDLAFFDNSLKIIDEYTRSFSTLDALKKDLNDKLNITDSEIRLDYITNQANKIELPLLINDDYIQDDLSIDRVSEFEEARKLIFSSKNQSFLKGALKDNVSFTFNQPIYFSYKDQKLKTKYLDDNVYGRDLLKVYSQGVKEFKPRVITYLDEWKEEMLKLDPEIRYFFARSFYFLRKDYEKTLKESKIKNINIKKIIDSKLTKTNDKIISKDMELIIRYEDNR